MLPYYQTDLWLATCVRVSLIGYRTQHSRHEQMIHGRPRETRICFGDRFSKYYMQNYLCRGCDLNLCASRPILWVPRVFAVRELCICYYFYRAGHNDSNTSNLNRLLLLVMLRFELWEMILSCAKSIRSLSLKGNLLRKIIISIVF